MNVLSTYSNNVTDPSARIAEPSKSIKNQKGSNRTGKSESRARLADPCKSIQNQKGSNTIRKSGMESNLVRLKKRSFVSKVHKSQFNDQCGDESIHFKMDERTLSFSNIVEDSNTNTNTSMKDESKLAVGKQNKRKKSDSERDPGKVHLFFHSFESSNSNSSKRSRLSKKHFETRIEQMDNNINTVFYNSGISSTDTKQSKKNIKRSMKNKKKKWNKKMEKINTLIDTTTSSSKITMNDMERFPIIFMTWIDDPILNIQLSERKSVLVNNIYKTLSIRDTLSGSKMFGSSKYIPVYLLVPRDAWITNHAPNPHNDITSLQNVLHNWSKHSSRGSQRDGISSEYAYFGVTIPQGQRGTALRHPVLRKDYDHFGKMLKRMQFLATAWLPFGILTILKEVKKMCNAEASFDNCNNGFNEIWSSIATSYNYISPAHVDKDAFLGCLTVSHVPTKCKDANKYKYEMELPPAVFFCFPEHGQAIALRPGDVLFFNPREYHCISQRTKEYKDEKVYVTSFYLKTSQISLNDNSINCNEDMFLMDNLSIID
jgi:hypothetical protein